MVPQKLGANVTDVRIVVHDTLLRESSRGMIKKIPQTAIRMYIDGLGFRKIGRQLKISHVTVMKLGVHSFVVESSGLSVYPWLAECLVSPGITHVVTLSRRRRV